MGDSMDMFKRDEFSDDDLVIGQLHPDHDLDLVALLQNARTDTELQDALRLTRNRMRSRRGAQAAAQPRRGLMRARASKLTRAPRRRG